jgi:hypothetical protein
MGFGAFKGRMGMTNKEYVIRVMEATAETGYQILKEFTAIADLVLDSEHSAFTGMSEKNRKLVAEAFMQTGVHLAKELIANSVRNSSEFLGEDALNDLAKSRVLELSTRKIRERGENDGQAG